MKTFNLKKLEIGGGIPKIAVPVQGKTAGELLSAVPPADAAADLLEIRLDSLDSFRDEKTLLLLSRRLRELTRKPLLFTLRTAPEGGSAEVSETEYASVLRFLLRECRPDLLDVEFLRGAARELLSEARRSAVPTVASCHDFRKTPEAAFIEKMFRQMSEAGASVAKAALMPVNEADVEKVLSAGLSLKKTLDIPRILISMGEQGKITRFGAEQLGSCVTFGAAGCGSAPGQMEAGRLREILRERHEGRGDLFLIGFMGAGKSRVGRELSELTGLPVLEADRRIEELCGKTIPEIFREDGEAYFRQKEREVLDGLFSEGRCIVSCGGGMALRAYNVLQMQALGKVVLLRARPGTILERVSKKPDSRPLLAGRLSTEGIAGLMEQREPYYLRAADEIVDTDGRAPREIAEEIVSGHAVTRNEGVLQ